ncbi:MAG: hypothetical protein ABI365_00290 [Lysobacteraceae bacterium]
MAATVKWLNHEFRAYLPTPHWAAIGGIFMFVGVNQKHEWFPLHIGQAESLAESVPNHARWLESVRLGATHIHALAVTQAAMRNQIEQDLILAYQPKLNAHRDCNLLTDASARKWSVEDTFEWG